MLGKRARMSETVESKSVVRKELRKSSGEETSIGGGSMGSPRRGMGG